MRTLPIICSLLLSLSLTAGVSAHRPGRQTRLFRHIERLDPGTRVWRRYSATARITASRDSIEIVIWNNWADPRINPLAKIILVLPPARDTASGIWRYEGRIFRFSNAGKDCYVESCTKLANTQTPDFTIREADRTARYRISRKEHRKP